ncbi:MAG: VWA domain-containing protein, partial [Acidobacteriia bacterium]|nr:VWA domain-containing protein [Terriglobia bacterium]
MSNPKYLSLLAMGFLAMPFSGVVARADEPVVFRSDVSLVRVEAQVVDRSNRPIQGLGPQDFVLRENGVVQKIQSVDSENMPIDLLLLLDVSASMRPHIQRISTASHDALRQMRDNDRIAIMVFDRSTRVRMRFGSAREGERELEQLLYDETFRGGTDITLGMYDAADYIRREGRPQARKAIVIVTDDETERNRDVDGVS